MPGEFKGNISGWMIAYTQIKTSMLLVKSRNCNTIFSNKLIVLTTTITGLMIC